MSAIRPPRRTSLSMRSRKSLFAAIRLPFSSAEISALSAPNQSWQTGRRTILACSNRIAAEDGVPMQPQIAARIRPQFLLHLLRLIGVFKFDRIQSKVNEPVHFDEFHAERVVHPERPCELLGNVAVICSLHP